MLRASLPAGAFLALLALSLAHLLFQIPFLDQLPAVAVDEPWYGDTAHNLATGRGLINTNAGEGGGDRFFLYPLVLAGAFKAFGTSLWLGRMVSVLFGLMALWGWVFLCRKLAIHGWPLLVTGSLFVFSNVHFILFRRLRPEALVLALSVWALLFFIEAWETRRARPAVACALLAGAAAMAHPNGGLLAVLFAVLLTARAMYRRGARALLGYIGGGAGILALFALGLALLKDASLSRFVEDLLQTRRLSLTNTNALSAFWTNLATFAPAYSLGFKRLFILLFEIGILLVGLIRFRHDRVAALLSIAGLSWLILGLAILTPFFRWAFSIVAIFSLAVTGRLLSSEAMTRAPSKSTTLRLLTLAYAINTLAGDAYVFQLHASNTPYTRVVQTIDAAVADGVPVVTHLDLWFAFQRNPVYTSYTRWSTTAYAGFPDLRSSGNVRYVVLSSALTRGLSPTTGQQDAAHGEVERAHRFYEAAYDYARAHGQRIAVVQTRGYGDIEIWECEPARP